MGNVIGSGFDRGWERGKMLNLGWTLHIGDGDGIRHTSGDDK